MRKRLWSILLCVFVLLCNCSCGAKEQGKGEYVIYYLNIENTKIVPENYKNTKAKEEELAWELLNRLSAEPDSSQLRRTIPSEVMVQDVSSKGAYLTVDFNENYKNLSVAEEVLIRAAIVRTLLQIPEYSIISFTVDSEPLCFQDGEVVGGMSADSFVENPGQQIAGSVEKYITLYFASSDGTKLVKENRKVHYNTNISMEKMVMEELIDGPKNPKTLATVPSETKVITVSVVNGICYVNLSDGFKKQNPEIKEEVVLYSIVNSMTELAGVTKVQISINGDTKGKLRYTYELSKMYESNQKLIQENE